MHESYKFVVVEDKEIDRQEIQSRLVRAEFDEHKKLASPATYDEALNILQERAEEIDVLFLDLNIPRNDTDQRPEKAHGRALLDFVHDDLNRRPGVHIRVIIISGEELLDDWNDRMLQRSYPGTLVGISQKSALEKTLKRSLKQLRRDQLISKLRRAELDVLEDYQELRDGTVPVADRLKAARRLAIRLVRHEVDHYLDEVGASEPWADDLNGLIKTHIEIRFEPDQPGGRRYIKASAIATKGGWGSFLWRGALVNHLYTLNSYRNTCEHEAEQPYRRRPDDEDAWDIPVEVLDSCCRFEAAAQIAEAIVRELLSWYLPWHEQVYLPWKEGKTET